MKQDNTDVLGSDVQTVWVLLGYIQYWPIDMLRQHKKMLEDSYLKLGEIIDLTRGTWPDHKGEDTSSQTGQ